MLFLSSLQCYPAIASDVLSGGGEETSQDYTPVLLEVVRSRRRGSDSIVRNHARLLQFANGDINCIRAGLGSPDC